MGEKSNREKGHSERSPSEKKKVIEEKQSHRGKKLQEKVTLYGGL